MALRLAEEDGQSTFGEATIFELSTESVPAAERLSFWRDTAYRRMELERVPETGRPFRAELRRLAGNAAELWDHRSDPLWVKRTESRCRADGRGDISIALVLDCTDANVENGRDLSLRAGDLYVLDYAQPVRAMRSRHREIALILPREKVVAALGEDLSALAATRVFGHGIGAVLRTHMRTVADEAARLTESDRAVAVDAAADLSLAALRATLLGSFDAEQFADGIYMAARKVIDRDCTDPELTPDRVAARAGCSRATLYRLFAAHGETPAEAIWSARLAHALLLLSATPSDVTVAEIGFRCGFLDPTSFNRMFKRRYRMTPGEARNERRPSET